jgi:uncharacterized damage-inducible protein DinB
MLQLFRELYDHMRWADAVVWRAALSHEPAGGDATLRDRFVHIHMVQRAFLFVWRGEAQHYPESFDTLGDVARWGREYHDDVQSHFAALDDAALDRTVILPWAERLTRRFGRQPAPTTLRETMMQVPMHSTYHRGQVNTRLRELGAEPPLTDYIAWLWMGKPAAEWP